MSTLSVSALGAAETAFGFLTCPPAPLAVDGHLIAGLPDRAIPLDELRVLILSRRFGLETTDGVWRQLIAHAREQGPAWVVGAVGVAMPGLRRIVSRLSRGHLRHADDIESEVLAGFLDALRGIDLEAPSVWVRLCWAAWRAGVTARDVTSVVELPLDVDNGSRSPSRPYGHPDLVLGRAVAAGIITAAQAELIGATRLGDVFIDEIGHRQGLSAPVVRMRRRRAERILVAAIHRGDLTDVLVPTVVQGRR